MYLKPVYRLFRVGRYRFIICNHWSKTFNDSFLLVMGWEHQGFGLVVYRFGLFNFCLCMFIDRKEITT